MSNSVEVIVRRFTGFCIAGIRKLPGPFKEVLDCSLPALFVWVVLENLLLLDLELYNKGKNCPCKIVVCVISQEIPDPRQCQSASKELSLREVFPLGDHRASQSTILRFVVVCLLRVRSVVGRGG